MSKLIHKQHNVSCLLYRFVCPAKYSRKVFSEIVEQSLKEICNDIEVRYEITFVGIGADEDHVHFLVQSVSVQSPKRIIQAIKSATARALFKRHPEIKKILWGTALWTSGYYVNTVGRKSNEESVQCYVQNQGGTYKQLQRKELIDQLALF
ncbi:MAG: IS200/IS605 family transposase [Patescibacteria group bacterium]